MSVKAYFVEMPAAIYALQVSLLMSIKAYFPGMHAAIPCSLCPLGLNVQVLKGLLFRNACSHCLFVMPFKSQL